MLTHATDRILAHRVLVERIQFRRGLLAAHVDITKVVLSVHKDTLGHSKSSWNSCKAYRTDD